MIIEALWVFFFFFALIVYIYISSSNYTCILHLLFDCFSTAKGILGLAGMYVRDPDAKWFGVVGDDVYIDSANLVNMLSAFNPDEEWCIVDANTQARKTAGSSWRISGGAPVITSRALTKRLFPYLKSFSDKADRSIVHDLQFTMLMGLKVDNHSPNFLKAFVAFVFS
jgi:hypothetical protein